MKILYTFILLSTLTLFAQEDYEDYKPQSFFSANDVNTFFNSQAGEVLKKIIVNNHEYYMEQDGDLFDEDVASIDDEIFSAKGERYSFGKSKRLLATKIYPSHQKAFYSNCDYKIVEKKLVPIPETCEFHYRKNKNRSQRIEWEHIVPAWHFGHQLHCWQNGGRMTCRTKNSKFKQMEADMHNLVPAIGEINGDRSNFRYGMIEGEERLYGKVDMEIAFSDKRAEPRPEVRGDIARTYFYMRDRYGLRISQSQEKMLIAWNNLDPVDSWEKKKNQMVKELQGDENMYITNYHKIKQLGGSKEEVNSNNHSPSNSFNDVKEELAKKYSFIFDNIPPQIATILLTLLTIFVIYRRKSKKKTKETKTPKEQQQSTIVETKGVMIISKLGDVAISFNEEDEVIIEKTDKNSPNQIWKFTKANKQKEFFFIENVATNRVIEVKDRDSNDEAEIVMAKKRRTKNDHQEWSLESSKDEGYVFIINRETLNVLDIKDKKSSNGTKLQSFHKKVRGTENQEWKIERV